MLYQVLKKLQKFVAELLKSSSNHVEILNFNFLYFFDSIILLRNVKKNFFFQYVNYAFWNATEISHSSIFTIQ